MELHDGTLSGNTSAHALHLALEHAQVWRRNGFVLLDDYVASAKKAQAFAEGKVHVQRHGTACVLSLLMHFFEVGGSKGIVPDRSRRVAGVARPGTIVAL